MNNYRADVDGLRAVAIISVLLFHFFPISFPSGFIGVDIFFVISGFLITSNIINALDNQTFSFIDFYSRRIRRIFPGLLLILAFAIVFGWYFLLVDEYIQLGKHIVAASVFTPNLILWKEAGNYFDTAVELKPLLHLWSLGIEEQFYLFWPVLLVFFHRLKWNLISTLTVFTVISFAVNLLMISKDPVGTFYFPWTRAWELSMGGILALSLQNRSFLSLRHHNYVSLVGISLLVTGFLLIDKKSSFPGYLALFPCLGCLCFIVTPQSWFSREILSNRAMVFVGLISFPLYLWHWIILAFSRILNPQLSVSKLFLIMILTGVLSVATYKFVELPARRIGKSGTLFLLLFALGLGIIGRMIWKEGILSRAHGYNLEKITDAIAEPFIWPSAASKTVKFGESTFYKLGDSDSEVVFVGDSNMQQYVPRIEKITMNRNANKSAVIATHHSCMPIRYASNSKFPACNQMMEDVFNYIKSSNKVVGVVIGGAWFFYFDGEGKYIKDGLDLVISKDSEGMRRIFANFKEDLKKLKNRGIRTYIILNIPFGAQGDPVKMIKRSFSIAGFEIVEPEFISQKPLVQKFGWINKEIRQMAQDSGTIVIDPMDYFCRGGKCITRDENGEPVYKDETHYRNRFIQENAGFIDQMLN